MNLHVVANPHLAPADLERIQACRRDHNTLYNLIGPHFTLVFSITDIPLADFVREVKARVIGIYPIQFILRCGTINKDALSDYYDVFLVPDEGHSSIIRLHDRLYSDIFAAHHRLDIPYVPHISVANSTDPQETKRIVDEWNAVDFAIPGTISWLDVINYENRVITTVERVRLEG